MTTGRTTTAGTAADGYRTTPAPHPWDPINPDPGERPRCRHCGTSRAGHTTAIIPTPRRAT